MHLYFDLIVNFWASLSGIEKSMVVHLGVMPAFGLFLCKISWDERKVLRTIVGIVLTTLPIVAIPLISEIMDMLFPE